MAGRAGIGPDFLLWLSHFSPQGPTREPSHIGAFRCFHPREVCMPSRRADPGFDVMLGGYPLGAFPVQSQGEPSPSRSANPGFDLWWNRPDSNRRPSWAMSSQRLLPSELLFRLRPLPNPAANPAALADLPFGSAFYLSQFLNRAIPFTHPSTQIQPYSTASDPCEKHIYDMIGRRDIPILSKEREYFQQVESFILPSLLSFPHLVRIVEQTGFEPATLLGYVLPKALAI